MRGPLIGLLPLVVRMPPNRGCLLPQAPVAAPPVVPDTVRLWSQNRWGIKQTLLDTQKSKEQQVLSTGSEIGNEAGEILCGAGISPAASGFGPEKEDYESSADEKEVILEAGEEEPGDDVDESNEEGEDGSGDDVDAVAVGVKVAEAVENVISLNQVDAPPPLYQGIRINIL
ncbi:hypothetical protein U1Q18_040823 [Sarracenia purpurea var. burkii]